MAGVTLKMIDRIQRALQSTGSEHRRLLDKIRSDELATDVLEHQIHEYLSELVHEQLSSAASKETLSLMSMTNDLERIGDHGEKVSMLLGRVDESKLDLTEEGRAELLEMAEAARVNLEAMRDLILHRQANPMPAAEEREEKLNALRDQYRQSQLQRMIDGKCDAVTGVIFTDLLTSFEKMGDHAFNVIEATAGIK